MPVSGIPASGIPASGIPASGIPASGIPASAPPSPGGALGALGSRRPSADRLPIDRPGPDRQLDRPAPDRQIDRSASDRQFDRPADDRQLDHAASDRQSDRPSADRVDDPRGPLPELGSPLPVRNPGANTPPVPEHFVPSDPAETPFEPGWTQPASAPSGDLPRRGPASAEQGGGFPQGPASPQATAAQQSSPASPPSSPAQPNSPAQQNSPTIQQGSLASQPGTPAEPSPGFGTPLPRRQATSPSDGPPASMTSFPAFQTRADTAARAEAATADSSRPGLPPPVIPGSPGTDRPGRLGQPPLDVRGATAASPYSVTPEAYNAPPVPAGYSSQAPAAYQPQGPAAYQPQAPEAYQPQGPAAYQPQSPQHPQANPFTPANDVEQDLLDAAGGGSTDAFLSTLLLATVLVPVANHSRPGSAPGESGFAFRTEQMDGEHFLIVFTSKDRLAEHYAEPTRTVGVRFYELIRNWPDPSWSFAVNPNSPIGAKYPGPQVIALASWAAEAGLGADQDGPVADDVVAGPVPVPEPASDDAQHATVMQKTLLPDQVDYYLERGYDRVAGFVHRATEVEHLRTPTELFAALGLSYEGSQHQPDAKEAYVLRWPAYRPSLYRIPYGGQNEQALRAMDGWVIERAPFRGNGFAPGEGRDVIAEFKVDSVRLPQGAQLWRIDVDGNERMVAIFDNDGPIWRRVGEQ
jgi:hypothetical protein